MLAGRRVLRIVCLSVAVAAPGACVLDWSRQGAPADGPAVSDGGAERDGATATGDTGSGCSVQVKRSCSGGWCALTAGCFQMGSPASEPCREPGGSSIKETRHQVRLTHAFVISQLEVSQGQFRKVMGYNPACSSSTPPSACSQSWHSGRLVLKSCTDEQACPVENITWQEAAEYCNRLSAQQKKARCYENIATGSCTGTGGYGECKQTAAGGRPICIGGTCVFLRLRSAYRTIYDCPGYRLPTEAEWEYAYRAGTSTGYYNGRPDPTRCSSCKANDVDQTLGRIGWYCANSASKVHRSDERSLPKLANAWGLHEMAGNLAEWCHDGLLHDLGSGAVTDPVVEPSSTARIIRGGQLTSRSSMTRAAARMAGAAYLPGLTGFRCVRRAP